MVVEGGERTRQEEEEEEEEEEEDEVLVVEVEVAASVVVTLVEVVEGVVGSVEGGEVVVDSEVEEGAVDSVEVGVVDEVVVVVVVVEEEEEVVVVVLANPGSHLLHPLNDPYPPVPTMVVHRLHHLHQDSTVLVEGVVVPLHHDRPWRRHLHLASVLLHLPPPCAVPFLLPCSSGVLFARHHQLLRSLGEVADKGNRISSRW